VQFPAGLGRIIAFIVLILVVMIIVALTLFHLPPVSGIVAYILIGLLALAMLV
jgi:hypothetical protein